MNAIDSQEAKQPGWSKALLAKLCDGNAVHEDFPDETSEQIRASIETLLVESGWVREAPVHFRRVGIDFMMIAGILWNSGDPDWKGVAKLHKGVRLGVGVKLPRTPAVYPRKNEVAAQTGGA